MLKARLARGQSHNKRTHEVINMHNFSFIIFWNWQRNHHSAKIKCLQCSVWKTRMQWLNRRGSPCVCVHVCDREKCRQRGRVRKIEWQRERERERKGLKCVCCPHHPCLLKVGTAGCLIGHSCASLSQSPGLADRSVRHLLRVVLAPTLHPTPAAESRGNSREK